MVPSTLPDRVRRALYAVVIVVAGFLASGRSVSATDLYVGSNTSGNTSNFTSGTNIFGKVYVGFTNNASSNSLVVANTNTVLQFSNGPAGFFIGNYGSYNSMTISNGGAVIGAATLQIGNYSTSSNNSVIVSGSNSTINSGGLYVGGSGNGNTLVISNGGFVSSGYTNIIGFSSNTFNNSVLVIGSNSLWSNHSVAIGYYGSATLIVANGGTVNGSIDIGYQTGSSGTLNIGRYGTNDTAGSIISPTITFNSGSGTLNFNQTDSTTITSSISGFGTVNQLGSGTTILTGGNTYSGVTKISAGVLQIGNGGMTGSLGYSSVTNNGILIFDRSDTISLGDTNNISISGTGSLQQIGSGTLVLTVFNSYAGTTTISGGTIQVGNGRTDGTLGNGSVTNNGSLAFNRSDSYAFSNAISGSGSITQLGSGTTIFSGSNSYTGGTYVSSGMLTLTNSGTLGAASSMVSIGNSGMINLGTKGINNSTFTISGGELTNGTLTATNGYFLNGGLVAANLGIGVLFVGGSSTLSGDAGAYSVNITNGAFLLSGLLTNYATLSVGSGATLNLANNEAISQLGLGNGTITGTGTLTSGGAFNLTNAAAALISTSLAGSSSLTQSGSGITIISGTNSYSGPTIISAGTLQVGNGGTSGTLGNGMVTNNSFLLFNRSGSYVVTNNISGSGTNIQIGSGTLVFAGTTTNSTILDGGQTIVTGSISNTTASFLAGNSNGNVLMVISNGGTVIDSNASIGYSSTSSSNSVLVTGAGSTWSNKSAVTIGYSGSGNQLSISNGGTVISDNGIGTPSHRLSIGFSSNSSNNSVLVTGAGSTWSNNNNFTIGCYGSGNQLSISNGGTVISGGGNVGLYSSSVSNTVLVTGSGSVWSISTNALFVGGGDYGPSSGGWGNSLVISNGGTVITAYGGSFIGYSSNSSNNSVLVTGAGSTWSNNSGLYIGSSGSGNSLVISNGGTVATGLNGASIGGSATVSNNSVLVTGSNSVWSNSGSLGVGGLLTVARGGIVQSSGGITLAANNSSIGTLNIGSYGGTDAAGIISTPTITFGSGSGTINFNQTNSTTLTSSISGNGIINQLGSGKTILSASNTFSGPTVVNAGTLVISATGSFSGSGTTTVNSGGTLQNNGLIAATTTVNGTLAGNGGTFGSLKINGGSGLIWDISSLTGTAGIGWAALNTTNLDLSGMSSSNQMTIYIYGGTGTGDGSASYTFNFLSATNTITGFDMRNFIIDTSNFTAGGGVSGGTWSIGTNSISGGGQALSLVYAVPEPSGYAFFGLSALALLIASRRRAV